MKTQAPAPSFTFDGSVPLKRAARPLALILFDHAQRLAREGRTLLPPKHGGPYASGCPFPAWGIFAWLTRSVSA